MRCRTVVFLFVLFSSCSPEASARKALPETLPVLDRTVSFSSEDLLQELEVRVVVLTPGLLEATDLYLGRAFHDFDWEEERPPVALLSFSFWEELGENPALVGTRLSIRGTEATIVGVTVEGFGASTEADLFVPRS